MNNALLRADQISHSEGRAGIDWMLPIVADAEAGFGGTMNAFEFMKGDDRGGCCGSALRGSVVFRPEMRTPWRQGAGSDRRSDPEAGGGAPGSRHHGRANGHHRPHRRRLGQLVTSDYDTRDQRFLTGERTVEGFYVYRGGMQAAIARGLAYAPYADLLWCETSEPNLHEARQFANAIHAQFPGKMLAYNCSPSFHWRAKLNEDDIACFQRDLASHGLSLPVHDAGRLSRPQSVHVSAGRGLRPSGMTAYSQIQQLELEMVEKQGYGGVKHQRSVGTGYFDAVATTIAAGRHVHRALCRSRLKASSSRSTGLQ